MARNYSCTAIHGVSLNAYALGFALTKVDPVKKMLFLLWKMETMYIYQSMWWFDFSPFQESRMALKVFLISPYEIGRDFDWRIKR